MFGGLVLFGWVFFLQMRGHADALSRNQSNHVASGVAWHRKKGGKILMQQWVLELSREAVFVFGRNSATVKVAAWLLKITCSAQKEKHKFQNTESAALKKSKWPQCGEQVLRNSSHFLSHLWLCGCWRLRGDTEIKLSVNKGHCMYKY